MANPHPKDPIPPYLLKGTAQALLAVQVIVNNLCEVKRRQQCEHHREQHRESHTMERGSPDPPHRVLRSTRALGSLPALMTLSVWFMMNLSGATQKSLVPCGDETEHSGVGTVLSNSTATPRPPLTTAAAVSTAMEHQLRMRVRSPQHNILQGEG